MEPQRIELLVGAFVVTILAIIVDSTWHNTTANVVTVVIGGVIVIAVAVYREAKRR